MNPVRTCVGCGQRGNRADLLRFINNSGYLEPDQSKSAQGRGAWLHPWAKCFEQAITRKAFGRALKASVENRLNPSDLDEFIEQAETMLEN